MTGPSKRRLNPKQKEMKMAATKYKEVVVRPDVILPAISTEQPEKPYSFLNFLSEWLVGARGMRKDENLPFLFEWEETLETFTKAMAAKAGVVEPPIPAKIEPPVATGDEVISLQAMVTYREALQEQVKTFNEAREAYLKGVNAASVGEIIYVTEAAFKAGKESAKQALDAAGTPNERGQTTIAKMWEPKVLRHYHAFGQSKTIDEKDVPRGAPLALPTNGHAEASAE